MHTAAIACVAACGVSAFLFDDRHGIGLIALLVFAVGAAAFLSLS